MNKQPVDYKKTQETGVYRVYYLDGTNETKKHSAGERLTMQREVKRYKESVMQNAEKAQQDTPVSAPEPQAIKPAKRVGTEPWRRASLLEVRVKPYIEQNFIVRPCAPSKVARKKLMGWTLLERSEMEDQGCLTINDTNLPTDAPVQIREMVWMKLPRERKEARDKYYQEQIDSSEKALGDRLSNDISSQGGKASGTIDIGR